MRVSQLFALVLLGAALLAAPLRAEEFSEEQLLVDVVPSVSAPSLADLEHDPTPVDTDAASSNYKISSSQLASAVGLSSANANKWVGAINEAAAKYGINSAKRMAGFLSQTGHESGSFQWLVENLNYSASALRSVFRKYFPTQALANAYARKPEKIANRVYANRMGNGSEGSGDGWKYRGRGLIQLTGKNNYRSMTASFKVDVVKNPQLVQQPKFAALSAGWFWYANGLNALADKKDVVGMTKRINGGTNGLADRQARYKKACAALKC